MQANEDWDFIAQSIVDDLNYELSAKVEGLKAYNTELAIKICMAVATDPRSLSEICASNPDFPQRRVIEKWRMVHPVFARNFNAAKKVQAQVLIDEIIEIADDPANCETEINAWAKTRISARQWIASKILPKIYGDKQVIETITTENAELKAELAELRAKLEAKARADY